MARGGGKQGGELGEQDPRRLPDSSDLLSAPRAAESETAPAIRGCVILICMVQAV